MADLSVKVFNPRGKRGDGGGLVVQVAVSEADVLAWLEPSATKRVAFGRAMQQAFAEAGRALVLALEERERAARRID